MLVLRGRDVGMGLPEQCSWSAGCFLVRCIGHGRHHGVDGSHPRRTAAFRLPAICARSDAGVFLFSE